MTETTGNIDAGEIAKFDALASRWWDPAGEFRPLHEINPLRVAYIRDRCNLSSRRVLDIGCGGGILSEALARAGADVTGIDAAEGPLSVAKLHRAETGVEVNYELANAEDYAARSADSFEIVTCLEMLEHVPDPGSVIEAIARLTRPGGDVFISTINRNPKAFLLAIVGAEYLLRLLPAGTHEYEKFIRPSELEAMARTHGLAHRHSIGLHYNPITREYRLGTGLDVNYMMHFRKSGDS